MWLCCLGTSFICLRRSVTFICVRAIHTSKVYPIKDKKSNQWSLICCRTRIKGILATIYSNIKCVGSTIKYIGFEPINYAINLDVVSSYKVFNDFDFMFLSMY